MRRILITTVLGLSAAFLLSGCSLFQTGSDETTTTTPEEAPTPTPTPPAQAQVASISGTLSVEGAVVQGTTALMLQRQVGEIEFTEFDRQPAADGMEWSFDEAVAGVPYEITAAIQVDLENVGTSNVVTASAPAAGNELFVSTELNLPAPSTLPRVTCGDPDDANGYNATLFFPKVEDAAGYYGQVGSQPGGTDVFSGGAEAPQDDPEISVYLKSDVQAYARYAYTLCADCNVYDTQNWSGWSPTLGFSCPVRN